MAIVRTCPPSHISRSPSHNVSKDYSALLSVLYAPIPSAPYAIIGSDAPYHGSEVVSSHP